MEEGQSPSALSAHNSGPNVSAVPRPTIARQALNQAITPLFGKKPPQQQQQSRRVLLLSPPQEQQQDLLRRSRRVLRSP